MEAPGNGCMMQDKFVDRILYADDILLIFKSRLKLK